MNESLNKPATCTTNRDVPSKHTQEVCFAVF